MNNSVKARLTVLQRMAAQKRSGVAIMALQEDGTWTACKGPQSPEKVFQTEREAQAYLSECENIIVIDV